MQESNDEADAPKPTASTSASSVAQSGMGAATQADQYDEDHIFRYLVFYLDTSDNAKKNNFAKEDDDSLAANAAENDRR